MKTGKHTYIIIFLILLGIIYLNLKSSNRITDSTPGHSVTAGNAEISNMLEAMSFQRTTKAVKAPDFELTSLSGEDVSIRQYRGKVVLLSFWATW
jgi:cytochrome oxidase Cu insertion factor (SCO1/SenC/PrrC family)